MGAANVVCGVRVLGYGLKSDSSVGVMATAAQRAPEGWKRGGLLKGVGLPAPSGRYAVGCVDLMHQVSSQLFPALPAVQLCVSSLVIIYSLAISCSIWL